MLRSSPWPGSLLLTVLAIAILQLDIGQPPEFDELYHVLAAEGWLQTGQFSIAEGEYQRVGFYTWLIGNLFGWFGTSIEVARQPSVIACAVLVGCVFFWTWRSCGPAAAWITGILFGLSPFVVDIAQFIRFYALQGLVFFIAAISVYAGLADNRSNRGRIGFGVLAAIMLAIGAYLQPVTLIGAVGLGAWAAVMVAITWMQDAGPAFYRRLAMLGGLALAGLVVAIAILVSELGAGLIAQYRWNPVWNAAVRGQVVFYHVWLVLYYPTLWTLFPVLAIVAVAAKPRPVAFAATIFIVAFLLHSFAGVKDLRYIFYALPFLFIIWGVALGVLLNRLIAFIREQMDITGQRLPPWLANILRPACWVAMVVFLIAANAASVRTTTMLAGITIPPEIPPADWQATRPVLQSWLDEADVVITSSELHALYYLDRYDLLLSNSRITEVGGQQLNRDHRTGRPVISDINMVEAIIECYPKGLLVSSEYRWRNASQIDEGIADLITGRARRLTLPENSRMLAFGWDHEDLMDRPDNCPEWQNADPIEQDTSTD